VLLAREQRTTPTFTPHVAQARQHENTTQTCPKITGNDSTTIPIHQFNNKRKNHVVNAHENDCNDQPCEITDGSCQANGTRATDARKLVNTTNTEATHQFIRHQIS
jgi:hypothetical protein